MQFITPTRAKIMLCVVLHILIGIVSSLAQSGLSLPGGASSLQETYDDWRVNCAKQAEISNPVCTISQIQAQTNGQRILSIELMGINDNNSVKGNLVLPFGLLLDAGIGLQVDDGATGEGVAFRTCFPSGCIAPLVLDAKTTGAMNKGTILKLHAKASGDDQPVNFQISLKGFAAAIDRAGKLTLAK